MAWQSAIAKAQGIKVKDNVDLLKKALKKKEKRTEKSKKDWAKRETLVDKKKKGVQEKRNANMTKRRVSKKEKSDKRSKKRGHLIPKF